jgi:hypothetical protein
MLLTARRRPDHPARKAGAKLSEKQKIPAMTATSVGNLILYLRGFSKIRVSLTDFSRNFWHPPSDVAKDSGPSCHLYKIINVLF